MSNIARNREIMAEHIRKQNSEKLPKATPAASKSASSVRPEQKSTISNRVSKPELKAGSKRRAEANSPERPAPTVGHGRLQLDVMNHLKKLHAEKMREPLTVEDIMEDLKADLHPDSMEFLRKDFLPNNEKVEMSSGPKFRFKPKYQFGNAEELHKLLLDLSDRGRPCVLEEDLMEAYAKAGKALKKLKARENVLLPDYVRKDKKVVIMVVPREGPVDQERLPEDDPIRALLNTVVPAKDVWSAQTKLEANGLTHFKIPRTINVGVVDKAKPKRRNKPLVYKSNADIAGLVDYNL